jgi:hypothetical protein
MPQVELYVFTREVDTVKDVDTVRVVRVWHWHRLQLQGSINDVSGDDIVYDKVVDTSIWFMRSIHNLAFKGVDPQVSIVYDVNGYHMREMCCC